MPTGYNKDGTHNGVETRFKKGSSGFTGSHTESTKLKISLKKIGRPGTWIGRKHSEETKSNMRFKRTGIKLSEEHKRKISESLKGDKHYAWKGGISNRDRHSLSNPDYKKWRTSVFTRDNFKCKISDNNCNGILEAHHILPWRDFVELRYQVNNGITLCHAHHPRKREDEAKLSPYFQQLVAEKQ